MRYAGFWRRLGSMLVDAALFAPLSFLLVTRYGQSRELAMLLVVPLSVFGAFFHIYFHGRWGQTPGKMLTKIRVTAVDGSPAGWRRAWLRSSVELVSGFVISIGQAVALYKIPDATFEKFSSASYLSKEQLELSQTIQALSPVPEWVMTLSLVWISSELLVLLFNKRRRALHDYIAGTVVVCVDSPSSTGAAA